MPLNFRNGGNAQPEPPAPSAGKPSTPGAVPSFMRRGKAAHDELDRAEKRQKERIEKAGSTYRFYIPKEGGERRLTFLDGDLNEDGMLDVSMFYEHGYIAYGTDHLDVRCTRDAEPCPLCDGDEPSYVGVFTVIEWTPWEDRDGNKHEYRRRLYMPKIQVLRKLQKKATKNGGLTGVTFDVSRTGPRDFRVGGDLDFVAKNTVAEVAADLEKPEHAQPCDYANEPELVYRTAAQIEELGICKRQPTIGGKKGGGLANPDAASNL